MVKAGACWRMVAALAVLVTAAAARADLPAAYRDGPYYDDLMGDIRRLQIIGSIPGDTTCTRNLSDPKPCPELKAALQEVIEKHNLPATQTTNDMLQAYAEGDFTKADRLYAAAKGYELPDHLQGSPLNSLGAEIASYSVRAEVRGDTECTNDVFAPKPCAQAIKAFNEFAEARGLPKTRGTAQMFYAYVEGDKATGDKLYAALQGKDLPPNDLLAEARSYGVPAELPNDTACENNYFAAKPCPAAVTAWRDFSRKHGLDLDRQSARLFQEYLQGNEVVADKLYATAKGITVAQLLQERGASVDEPSGTPLYVPIYPSSSD